MMMDAKSFLMYFFRQNLLIFQTFPHFFHFRRYIYKYNLWSVVHQELHDEV